MRGRPKIPKFQAVDLSPTDQLKQALNLVINILERFIGSFKRWLKYTPSETIEEYMRRKLNRIQTETNGRHISGATEREILKLFITTILENTHLPKENWVNRTYQNTDYVIRVGYIERFQDRLKVLMNSIEYDCIQTLIDKIKHIFFVTGNSDKEYIKNLFKKAEEWQDNLISLITLPEIYAEDSNFPLLTNGAIQALRSISSQFNNSTDSFITQGNFNVPTVPDEEFFKEWDGLKYQESYKDLLKLLGFKTDGINWYPSLENMPHLDENLINIFKGEDLCEITALPNGKNEVKFTMDTYSLHLIYYAIILKNINEISNIAQAWISYYFTRIIYSFFKAILIKEGNPLTHLMEEADLRERIFIPLWRIMAEKIPIPRRKLTYLKKEWLMMGPSETDNNIMRILDEL